VRRVLVLLAVIAAIAVGAWFRCAGPAPGPDSRSAAGSPGEPGEHGAARDRTRSGTVAARPPGPGTGEQTAADVAGALRAALRSGDEEGLRAAATALRRLLRTDPSSWDAAVKRLLDPSEDATVRAALALVIGTIDSPATDAVLLDALRTAASGGALEELRRAIVLGLGAMREPPDKDDVFAFGDRPWGEDGPGGLGITVRRTIEDASVRAALAGALRDAPEETRRAAAAALRHSLASPDTLAAFRTALREEKADAPVALVGESLAGVARRSRSAEERDAILRDLFARAEEEDLDGLRFRVTDDLDRVRLPDDVSGALHTLAASDRSFELRSFALDILTGGAATRAGGAGTEADESGATEVRRTRDLLVRTLESAVDPALRDLAARHLSRLPADAASSAALLHAVRTDAAWNVRYTALATLGEREGPESDAAIAAGKEDGDERVRALAAELEGEGD
jgi:HEAT repeat protein